MELQQFENILKNNGWEHTHYQTIFDLLSSENSIISFVDRNELFSTIKDIQFYEYYFSWHITDRYDNETAFITNLKKLDKFHTLNKNLYNEQDYNHFLKTNLFPIFDGEINLHFTLNQKIFNSYDDLTEQQIPIAITFLSPLNFYNFLHQQNLFIDILDSKILPYLLNLEREQIKSNNPIIQEGMLILENSFKNPSEFKNFTPFWQKYKKLLLPTNSKENDLELIENNTPELLTTYQNYLEQPNIDYEFDKIVLSQQISKFFFTHFEEFNSYCGQIPNALVWIYEARQFLEIQLFIDNLDNKHFEYIENFNDSKVFNRFANQILFSQRFNKSISYPKIKNLLTKNFDFENLFSNYELFPSAIPDLSKFENFLLQISNSMKEENLLPFYRANKLENKLEIKNINTKKPKI